MGWPCPSCSGLGLRGLDVEGRRSVVRQSAEFVDISPFALFVNLAGIVVWFLRRRHLLLLRFC
jgi:hypothetical protein